MNFFIYRKPGETVTTGYSSWCFCQGIHSNSFVIAPFEPVDYKIFSIPFDKKIKSKDIDLIMEREWARMPRKGYGIYGFPTQSTGKDEHTELVNTIVRKIKEGELEKCVASRVIVRSGHINLSETFDNLCESYPEAFVFCFFTAATGLWMGATPELMLGHRHNKYYAMALAGTLPSGCEDEWNAKNIHEHKVVSDYIEDVFNSKGLIVNKGNCRTVYAGPVKHLRTDIEGEHADNAPLPVDDMVMSLSPSPALSGMPKEHAIHIIDETETYKRGYYGGFIGPLYENRDFDMYVNLRSMQISLNRYCLYAGGGIMSDSEPEDEWEETEKKAETLGRHIILSQLTHSA